MGGGKRGKNSGSKSPSSEESDEVVLGTTKNTRKPRSRSQNDLNDYYYFGEKFAQLKISPTAKLEEREGEKRSRSSTVDWSTSPRQPSASSFDTLVFKKKNFKGEGLYEVRLFM